MIRTENAFVKVTKNKIAPEKGEIIKINAWWTGATKRFRVIKSEGINVVLLSLDDNTAGGNPWRTAFNEGETAQFENGNNYINYANGLLDNYLNTNYYNSLNDEMKAAIIPLNRVQSVYDSTFAAASGTFKLKSKDGTSISTFSRVTQKTIGERKCWALDIDDLVEYFNLSPNDILDSTDIINLYEQASGSSNDSFLASACTLLPSSTVWSIENVNTNYAITPDYYDNTRIIRPAFKIDLTNIDYIIE